MIVRLFLRRLAALALLCVAGCDAGPRLEVLCAASLVPEAERAAARFEADRDIPVTIRVGGSGTLLSEIELSGRGDVYIAADRSYVDLATDRGLIGSSATGRAMRAVLLTSRAELTGLDDLRSILESGPRIALADPDAAAIGKVLNKYLSEETWAALETAARRDGVIRPTVEAVANDVALGAADAAIVWDRVARRHPDLIKITLEELDACRGEWAAAVLNDATEPDLAAEFVRCLVDGADEP